MRGSLTLWGNAMDLNNRIKFFLAQLSGCMCKHLTSLEAHPWPEGSVSKSGCQVYLTPKTISDHSNSFKYCVGRINPKPMPKE